jgi:DNA ligase (NAD+)
MTKEIYDKLIDDLIKYSDSYYNNHISLIDDREFDMLIKQAEAIESVHADWIRKDSPTQNVGSGSKDGKIKHKRKMASLQNTYNEAEVREWATKMLSEYGVLDFIVEYKYDGVSFAARYENGNLIQGLTRGDGEYGEDITQNLREIDDLKNISPKFTGEVRGEILIEKAEFERLNIDGKYANPRNLASGTLKLLDVEKFKERKLRAYTYWLEDSNFNSHEGSLVYLRDNGFNVGKYFKANALKFEELWSIINQIEKDKSELLFEIDGAVLKVNQIGLWSQIGGTSKFPHWAKAYKYEPDTAITTVKDIEFWVGRTGKITPVAILEPVFLSGSTVQKVTLNNKGYMRAMDIKINDQVNIKKAAEIIPFINRVITENRLTDGKSRTRVEFPTHCPDCKTKLVKHNEEHSDFYCTNELCVSRIVGTIVKYTSEMEIDGFAEIIVEKLRSENFLCSIEDLYKLKKHRNEIIKLERMGEKLVDKLLLNIENSKTQKLEKFISAIGIKNVGKSTSKALYKKFGSLKLIMGASKEELTAIEDIGDIVAENIYNYFRKTENRQFINNMIEVHGMKFEEPDIVKEVESSPLKLDGKTFCITGALSLERGQYVRLIESLGGKISDSVSGKTNYLITNDKTTNTNKNIKARELAIPILNEKELLELCDALNLLKDFNY